MDRWVNNQFVNEADEIVRYTARENTRRRQVYRTSINQCCMPGCGKTWDLQVHHILPIKQGGSDSFTNFITLCGDCHRTGKLHKYSEDKMLEILVYKFYMEKLLLGYCSDDISSEEFQLRLMKSPYASKPDGPTCA